MEHCKQDISFKAHNTVNLIRLHPSVIGAKAVAEN